MRICVNRWEHLCLYRSPLYSFEIGDLLETDSLVECRTSLKIRKAPAILQFAHLITGTLSHAWLLYGALELELGWSYFHTKQFYLLIISVAP